MSRSGTPLGLTTDPRAGFAGKTWLESAYFSTRNHLFGNDFIKTAFQGGTNLTQ
jgi:hypothetical protein